MFFKKKTEDIVDNKAHLPEHVGIIMDGNGRWAQKRKMPRSSGHTAGASNFRTITKYASRLGIKYLTMYAFSTENWKRPQAEVGALMILFKQYLEEALRDFKEENIQVRFIGDVSGFSKDLQELIKRVERESAPKTGMILNLAMNYGGRAEIVRAVNKIIEKNPKAGEITEEDIAQNLYTSGMPDPDLIIRPSGEQRISNFLLWQSAYSEFVYFDILWPDFKPKDFDRAMEIYAQRNRRFGGV